MGVGGDGVGLAVDHDLHRGVGLGRAAERWGVVFGFVIAQGAGVAGRIQRACARSGGAGVQREGVDRGGTRQAVDGGGERGTGAVGAVSGEGALGEQLADAAGLDVGGLEGGAEHARAAIRQGDGGGDHVACAGAGGELGDDGHACV